MTPRETIRAELVRQGVSQSELARRIGKPQQMINRYLAGHHDAGSDLVGRMLDALGLTIGPTDAPG